MAIWADTLKTRAISPKPETLGYPVMHACTDMRLYPTTLVYPAMSRYATTHGYTVMRNYPEWKARWKHVIKWTSIAMASIIVAKILAFLERGYLAYGEEICAAVWVLLIYWTVHSEPFLAWKAKRRNKRRLKKLSKRVVIRNVL